MATVDSTSPLTNIQRIAFRFSNFSLRTKLLVVFLIITSLSIAAVAFAITVTMQANLTTQVQTTLQHEADIQAQSVVNLLDREVEKLETFVLSKTLQDQVAAASNGYRGSAGDIRLHITQLDQQWKTLKDTDPLLQQYFSNVSASELREYQALAKGIAEIFVTDKYGALVATTARTSDYDQSDETWWQATYQNGQGATYIGQPEYDTSSRTLGIIISVPIYGHATQEVVGVLRITYDIASVTELLKSTRFDQTGDRDILLPSGQLIRDEGELIDADNAELSALRQQKSNTTIELMFESNHRLLNQAPLVAGPSQEAAITQLGWIAIANQDPKEAFQLITAALQASLYVSVVALACTLLLAVLIAHWLSAPLNRITALATNIANGNLDQRLDIRRHDEIGTLAVAFNTMSEALVVRIQAEQLARTQAQQAQQIEAQQRQELEQTVARLRESFEVRDQLSATIYDLASPVLPVLEGILVMPLIGVIDSTRAEIIHTTLLHAIEDHRAAMVILDVTGVPIIDTQVARALIQAADAGMLLGAQTILVGLRPELAQTIVGLGLSLTNLISQADLQSGVAYAAEKLHRSPRRRVRL